MKGLSLAPVFLVLAAVSIVRADPPTITNQPADTLVNTLSAADFTVGAGNASSYQWLVNGNVVAGATNATLGLDDVTAAESVAVNVTSPDGTTVTSRTAALNVTNGTTVTLTISGYPDGGSSNVVIALFDHDKPATVENFLRYISAGLYTNMIFDRLVVDPADSLSIIQSGGYEADPQTNGTPTSPSLVPITSTSPFLNDAPPYLVNEYQTGPIIHNRAGTIAMAKQSSGTPVAPEDSAQAAFFFNLADNSTNLDNQNGGFTVFGRVIGGQAALDYFLNITNGGGGVFDATPYPPYSTSGTLTDLPVNYSDFGFPVNSNMFYATFSAVPAPETVLPTAAVTQINTNTRNMVITGTASDNVAVAQVAATILRPSTGQAASPIVTGTTNWTQKVGPLPAGDGYQLEVAAVDGAWNRAASASNAPNSGQAVVISFNVPNYPLAVTTSGNGGGTATIQWEVNGNTQTATAPVTLSGAMMAGGSNFVLTAAAARGSVFDGWTVDTNETYPGATLLFDNSTQNGGAIDASFVTKNLKQSGFAFTSPKAGGGVTNGNVTLAGKISANLNSPTVTCQIFDQAVHSSIILWGNGSYGMTVPRLLPTSLAVGSIITVTGCSMAAFNGTHQLTFVNFPGSDNPYNEIGWGPATGGTYLHDAQNSTALVTFPSETPPFAGGVNGNTWTASSPVTLPPGSYTARAVVTDGGQNTQVYSENFSVLAALNIEIVGPGRTSIQSKFVQIGKSYQLGATAEKGGVFYNWFSPQYRELNLGTFKFIDEAPVSWTASFVPNNLPAGFAISSPLPNATVNVTNFIVSGTVPAGDPLARVTCELFNGPYQVIAGNESPAFAVATNLTDTSWTAALRSVPPGTYKLIAVGYDRQGRERLVSQTIHVNAFGGGSAGSYQGVFFANTTRPNPVFSSGLLTLTVDDTGLATGRLKIPGETTAVPAGFPVRGRFGLDGTLKVSPGGYNGQAVTLSLTLPIGNSSEAMGCVIRQGAWSENFSMVRAATALTTEPTNGPSVGNYVLNFTPTNLAGNLGGIGYALVNVASNGTVNVAATMPDNVAFTEGTYVAEDGHWPLYLTSAAYKNKGAVLAWEQITNVDEMATNGVYWVKGAFNGPAAAYESNLGTVGLTTTGGLYAPPSDGQYTIVFSGGTMGAPVTNTLTYANGAFTPNGSVTAITFDPATGLISGQFNNPNSGNEAFTGAFINPLLGGGGLALDVAPQTARFTIVSASGSPP